MKNILLTLGLCFGAISSHAQVAFGKDSVEGSSTLMDFESNANFRGIILPSVEGEDNVVLGTENNGTFVYDKEDEIVKFWTASKGWTYLSDAGDASLLVENESDEVGEGVIIGADISEAEGVLVLESEDKAMILPHIFRPHETVKSPYPGMICFDTESLTLAVFDGENWNYWK
jgi:hypothetical protein